MNVNASNQIRAGQVLFREGDRTNCIYMVLKGKLALGNRGFRLVCGPGSILGLDQTGDTQSLYSCSALENSVVYVMSTENGRGLAGLLSGNKDYNGIAVYNHAKIIAELFRQVRALKSCSERIYRDIQAFYKEYFVYAEENDIKTVLMPEILQLPQLGSGAEDIQDLEIFLEYAKIPYDAMRSFYAPTVSLTTLRLFEMTSTERALMEACARISDYFVSIFMPMVGTADKSLYRNLLGLAIDMKRKGVDCTKVEPMLKSCCEFIIDARALLGSCVGRNWDIDDEALIGLYDTYREGNDFRGEDDVSGAAVESKLANIVNSLQNAYNQLVDFSGYEEERANKLAVIIEEFAALPNKDAGDDNVRKLRKELAEHFYELYLRVFKKTVETDHVPKAAELMLDYGFVSEKLLTNEQMLELVSLSLNAKSKRGRDAGSNDFCRVYSMSEWLKAVYRGDKEPSRNDMGMDYTECVRDMKKRGAISETEEKMLLDNPISKVEHEIKNVMPHASRVVNGQLLMYVPVLHSDVITGRLEDMLVTSEKINDTVKRILEIDYSVFCRETLFVDRERGIEKEFIVKNVPPVFVAYPTVGDNVIMWQEITGRKRDSEGRFFVGAFTASRMQDMMIKAFGQFRWSLCKIIQGTNWNNVSIKSLTSEYADYIQFYRKNHDLSDERKEKIKLQIQRGRNNLREVFTMDYEAWIKFEATGAVKLNKVAREILATYCPVSAQFREKLVRTPIFDEAFARSTRDRAKKVHELELRFKSYESKNISISDEMDYTLRYYRDF